MTTSRLVAVLLATALLGGCVAAPTGSSSPTTPAGTPTPTETETGTPTATPSPVSAADGCARWVSFWGLDGPRAEQLWEPDAVRVGYTVTANASVVFVAVENGTVLGTAHASTAGLDYGVTADGATIPLGEALSGSHTVRVRAVSDTNGNGEFDPGIDRPCETENGLVTSEAQTIDFDRFPGRESTDETDGTPTGDA